MTLPMRPSPARIVTAQPRAEGAMHLSVKAQGAGSALDRYRASGAFKALFPRRAPGGGVEAIAINTAGGITGGDRFSLHATAGPRAHLTLTTQAAERAYRSAGGWGRVDTRLTVSEGATLFWLPQELILYDGSALRRSLRADLAGTARLLLVEPVIFGRTAMGEVLETARFHDEIALFRAGVPLCCDRVRMDGDIAAQLSRRAVAQAGGAMASLVCVAPDAGAHLAAIRADLPETGGASLLHPDVLVLRIVAQDGFHLRRHLLPILDRLSNDTLPTSWRL